MGLCTINGVPATRARFTMPRQGCWVADVLAVDPVDGGKVTILNDDGITLVGTTERSGDWLETGYLRVAPGANGMKLPSKPKHYINGSIGLVAKDLLAAAGETLAPSSTSSLLSVQLPSYVLRRDAVGRCLTALLQDRRLVKTSTPGLASPFVLNPPNPGLVVTGNINLTTRPRVKNADGSISTVRSMSFEADGFEVLVPTVSDAGKLLTEDEAVALYFKTGKHLGKFSSPDAATSYAERLHDQQAQSLSGPVLDMPTWRALPDGTIWLGYETWPDSNQVAPDDYQRVKELPQQGRAELSFDSPILLPGTTLEGRRISAVEHVIAEDVTTTVWFED